MLYSSSITEPKNISDVVKFDLNDYSRESVTIAAGNGIIEIGEVLGIITATNKYAKFNSEAVNGTEIAAAISRKKVDATTTDILNAPVNTNLCTAVFCELVFNDDQSNTSKDQALLNLESNGFKIIKNSCTDFINSAFNDDGTINCQGVLYCDQTLSCGV